MSRRNMAVEIRWFYIGVVEDRSLIMLHVDWKNVTGVSEENTASLFSV